MIQSDISTKTENSLNSIEVEKQKDRQSQSTYIIKYTRKKTELTRKIEDTNLPKEKHCLFMFDFITYNNNNESFLVIKCHEIAAIHFEDFYERIYSFNDIIKENRYFKALDNIDEIKEIIDYIFSDNFRNTKKIFMELVNNSLNLHIKLSYFDTIKEIIFNIPKKTLKDEEKIILLPMILKEIQYKMTFYEKENKKFQGKINNEINNNNNPNFYDYYLKIEKEKEEENNKSCQHSNETNDTSNNNSITSEIKKTKKEIKLKKKKKTKSIKKVKVMENQNDEIKFENNFF